MFSHIDSLLVKLDNACDYAPVVSTLSNLVGLFQKYVVFNFLSCQTIQKNRYYTHLLKKSSVRSVMLLIPLIGNIFVAVTDYNQLQKRRCILEAFKQDPKTLQFVSKVYVLEIVQKDGLALEFASDELKSDYDVVLAAVEQNALAISFVKSTFKFFQNCNIAQAAFKQNPQILQFADESDILKSVFEMDV